MMDRRDELLRGIVRINNERVNIQSPKIPRRTEVRDSSGEGGVTAPEEHPGAEDAKAQSVQEPKESVWEYAERRKREVLEALQEADDRRAVLVEELQSVKDEVISFKNELALLKPLLKEGMNDNRSGTGKD